MSTMSDMPEGSSPKLFFALKTKKRVQPHYEMHGIRAAMEYPDNPLRDPVVSTGKRTFVDNSKNYQSEEHSHRPIIRVIRGNAGRDVFNLPWDDKYGRKVVFEKKDVEPQRPTGLRHVEPPRPIGSPPQRGLKRVPQDHSRDGQEVTLEQLLGRSRKRTGQSGPILLPNPETLTVDPPLGANIKKEKLSKEFQLINNSNFREYKPDSYHDQYKKKKDATRQFIHQEMEKQHQQEMQEQAKDVQALNKWDEIHTEKQKEKEIDKKLPVAANKRNNGNRSSMPAFKKPSSNALKTTS